MNNIIEFRSGNMQFNCQQQQIHYIIWSHQYTKTVRKWHTNTSFIVFYYQRLKCQICKIQKQDSTLSMGTTNVNKTMSSIPNSNKQEQQQVRETLLCCILLSLYSSNQHSYYNQHMATDTCNKPCKLIYKSLMSKF